MKSSEVRSKFIDFFKSKEHAFVPGSSTVPLGDQTILFTIAGMAQFKSSLTGEEKRPYKRATNSQKCIRIGDLDDVGKDGRHCTMFEMLGSWSFGDYFKKEAIEWAREFVKDELRFDMSKVWVSVHEKDDEAEELWKAAGQPAERLVRLGDKDNFWAMGPTGPCGPCTELHLDQGPAVGKCDVKGFDCKAGPGCDCDRYLEFWNLVFMQYDRKEDGTLVELEMKSIDTGSGLERVTALLQGKTSAFDIDTFMAIKEVIRARAGLAPFSAGVLDDEKTKESLNVIADHIRTLAFTLADGCNFGSEGRNYVLRRVLRRAVRHAHRLNPKFPRTESFLAGIVPAVVAQLGDFYPELKEQQSRIMELIRQEEARFVATLNSGLSKFNEFAAEARKDGRKQLAGEHVFLLHDTFGFPWDLTKVLCEETGLVADLAGFQKHMQVQKEKSRAEAKFYKFDNDDAPWVELSKGTQDEEKAFVGYGLESSTATKEGAEVHEIVLSKGQVRRVRQLGNRFFEVVLAGTPFYPEGGGQVADTGWLLSRAASSQSTRQGTGNADAPGTTWEFEVVDVRKTPAAIVHLLRHAELSEADADAVDATWMKNVFGSAAVSALVNVSNRMATARNHTATHLLHKALQLVLGDNVRQAGSQVSPTGLRFDFSHHKGMTSEEIARVETIVNREILKNADVVTHKDVLIDDAKRMGAMAIFDEKYDDRVRVLEVGGFSMELCGGTHVPRTGHIGQLRVTSESSVTAGVRRLEAVTGWGTLELASETKRVLSQAASELKCAEAELPARLSALKDMQKELERANAALQSRLVGALVEGLLASKRKVAGASGEVEVISAIHDASDIKELELLADRLKERHSGLIVVASAISGKAVVLAAVTPALTKQHKNLSAGNVVKALCELVDGKGGGRPDFARGGGNSPEKIPAALEKIDDIVRTLV
jgi:alanyl-tRNA synthetase